MILQPFNAYVGSTKPRVLFVGEAWGQSEDEQGVPFVGYAGREFTRLVARVWPGGQETLDLMNAYRPWLAARQEWFSRQDLGVTNVFNLRPKDNKIHSLCYADRKDRPANYALPPIGTVLGKGQLFLREEFFPETERLWQEIGEAEPNLIVALGNTACWALLGRRDIGQIRGTTTLTLGTTSIRVLARTSSIKVLPTYHPAAILHGMTKWRPIVLADFIKAKSESETRELIRPSRVVVVNPTLDDIDECSERIILADELAIDTETAKGQITRISFAPSPEWALVIPFRGKECLSNYWKNERDELYAWEWVARFLNTDAAKVFQNGLYDLQFLAKMGFRVRNCVDDTLILHHSQYLELPKSLAFLGSIYTQEPAWKLMRVRRKERGEKEDE